MTVYDIRPGQLWENDKCVVMILPPVRIIQHTADWQCVIMLLKEHVTWLSKADVVGRIVPFFSGSQWELLSDA